MKKAFWIIPMCAMTVLACSSAVPRFEQYPGEIERSVVKTVPYSYDAVWTGVRRVVDGYRVHTEDKKQGLMLTRWKMTVTNDVGQIARQSNYINGKAITEYSQSAEPGEKREFEVHNRLSIRVIPMGDSTNVSVTNRFWGQPHDYFGDHPVSSGDKAFSMTSFDTREECHVLDRIEEIAARQK